MQNFKKVYNKVLLKIINIENMKKMKSKEFVSDWVTQKLTKNLVLIKALHHLSFVHDRIRRYLMYFHSELSEIINWKKEPF